MADAAVVEPTTETPAATPAAPAAVAPAATTPAAPAAVTPEPTTEPARTEAAPAAKAPEKYELTRPDNSLFSPAQIESLARVTHALGLGKEQGQAFADAESMELSRLAQEYENASRADPSIGGANYDKTVALGRSGLLTAMQKAQNTPDEQAEILAFFNGTAQGNNKAFLRLTAWIGRQFAEDQPNANTATHAGSKVDLLPTEDVLFPSSAKKSA